MTPIFLFPGQSSTQPDIFGTARAVDPEGTAAALREASEVLGRDLAAHYANGSAFETNRDVQVGVFVCNYLHLQALRAHGIDAQLSLGLSLGEYSHLVHIGALSFADALRLVDERGRAYDSGPDGVMAAVWPVTPEELEPIIEQAREVGFVAVSNANSPTQQVIAGERAAVEEALRLLDEELFVAGRIIEERVPMHTERFKPVADAFRRALQSAPWQAPVRPYLPNTTAELVLEPTTDVFVDRLSDHVFRPVRWQQSIDAILERHPDACFVEVGPRTVLHDMLRKNWVGEARREHTADPEAFLRTVGALRGEA